MKKFVCSVCDYVHEGDSAPEKCPLCKQPAEKFNKHAGERQWAAEHAAEHAAKFAELLGEVVTDSTKKNLELRVDAENGATAGKFDLAKRAKELGLEVSHIDMIPLK